MGISAKKHWLTGALHSVAVVFLAACGGPTTPGPGEPAGCPAVGILADASRAFFLAVPNQPDPDQVIATARISDFVGDCEYDDAAGSGDMDLTLQVVAGPAFDGRALPVDYFVAVVDPGGQILNKEVFRVTAQVPDDARGLSLEESLALAVPLPAGPASGSAYELVVGLQLTPQQLQINRDPVLLSR